MNDFANAGIPMNFWKSKSTCLCSNLLWTIINVHNFIDWGSCTCSKAEEKIRRRKGKDINTEGANKKAKDQTKKEVPSF